MPPAIVEIIKVLQLASISITLFISLSLLFRNRKSKDKSATVLGAFLISMLALPIHGYIELTTGEIPLFISAAVHSFILLYSPMIYLFLNIVIKKGLPTNTQHLVFHFIPFLLLFSLKISPISYEVNFVLFTISLLIITYLVANISLIINHKKQLKLLFTQFTDSRYYWLAYIVVALQILIVFDLSLITAFVLKYNISAFYWQLVVIGISLYLLVFSAFFVRSSSIQANFLETNFLEAITPSNIHEETVQKETDQVENTKVENTVIASHEACVENSNHELSAELAADLEIQLNTLIQMQKPYLNNALSLSELAQLMQLSNAHLTELLNKHMDCSFYSYINTVRFNASLNLIKDPTCKLSMVDIAYQAGFNNKNTFYRIFKEKTGSTPKQYRLTATTNLV